MMNNSPKKNRSRRVITIFVCLLFTLSLIPYTVFATEAPPSTAPETATEVTTETTNTPGDETPAPEPEKEAAPEQEAAPEGNPLPPATNEPAPPAEGDTNGDDGATTQQPSAFGIEDDTALIEQITIESFTGSYDGQPHTVTVSNVPEGYKAQQAEYNVPSTFTDAPISRTIVGATTVYVRIVTADGNTVVRDAAQYNITINESALLSIESYSGAYDGQQHSLAATVPTGYTLQRSTQQYTGFADATEATISRTKVGKITFWARIVDGAGTIVLPAKQCFVEITLPQGIEISDDTVPYDGVSHQIKVINTNPNYVVKYATSQADSYSETNPSKLTNIGFTSVYVKVFTTAGDEVTDPVSYKITITEPAGMTISAYTGTYDGQPHGLLVANESSFTVQYSTSTTASSFTATPITHTEPGSYTVYVRVMNGSTVIKSATSYKITINKLVIKVKVSDAALSYVYGNEPPAITPTVMNASDLPGGLSAESLLEKISVTYGNTPEMKGNPSARNRPLVFQLDSSMTTYYTLELYNYANTKIATADTTGKASTTVQIIPRTFSFPSSPDIYYGDPVPDMNAFLAKSNYILGQSGDSGILPGDLPLIPYLATMNPNGRGVEGYRYVWNSSTNQFMVAPADWTLTSIDDFMAAKLNAGFYNYVVRINNNNYGTDDYGANTIHYGYATNVTASYSVRVLPKPLTITPNDIELTYGDAIPELSATMTATAYGETIEYSLVREPGVTAGTYTISVVVDRTRYSNYQITTPTATLVINEKPLAVQGTDTQYTYNGRQQSTTQFTTTGLVDGDKLVSGVSYLAQQKDVGTVQGDFTVDQTSLRIEDKDGNDVTGSYSLSTSTGTLQITPAPLTITANNLSVALGAAPSYGYSISGFVNNEDISVLEGAIAYTCAYKAGDSAAGQYPVVPSGFRAKNYAIAYLPGTLTVQAPPPETPTTPPVIPTGPTTPTPIPTRFVPVVTPTLTPATTTPVAEAVANSTVPLASAAGPNTEALQGNNVPLANAGNQHWSLVNLMLTVFTSLMTLLMLAGYFMQKKKHEDETETEQQRTRRRGALRLLTLLPAVATILLFVLTQNMRLPMALLDSWTPLMAVITIVQCLIIVLIKRANSHQEDESATA